MDLQARNHVSLKANYLEQIEALIATLQQAKLANPRHFTYDHPEVFDDDYDNDEYAVRVDVEEGGEEVVERETPEDALNAIIY